MREFLKLSFISAFLFVIICYNGQVPVFAGNVILNDVTAIPTDSTASATTNLTVAFTPQSSTNNGSVIKYLYDTAFSGGAALTDADIAINGTNITAKSCYGFIAGYFECSLTTSNTVSGKITTIIGNSNKLTNPVSPGNYNFAITVLLGGTGSDYDTGSGLVYISGENLALISAQVPPLLTFDIYNPGTAVQMTLPYTCSLGAITTFAVSSCNYDLGIGTNSPGGAGVTMLSGGPMTSGTYNIAYATGTPLVPDHEGYGFFISNPGNKFVPTGTFGNPVQVPPTTVTTIATSSTFSDKTTVANHITIQHSATASMLTAPGVYSQKYTYSAFTN